MKKILKSIYHKLKNSENKEVDNYFGRPILPYQEGNDIIRELLNEGKPAMIARIGSSELGCVATYLKRPQGRTDYWTEGDRRGVGRDSGVFPPTDETLERFAREFLEYLPLVDVMGVWFNHYEDHVCHHYAPQATLSLLRCIEPYYHENPWSEALKGKKVLVVHPFVKSIEQQFAKRELLHKDPRILPPFELQTLKAVQSLGYNKTEYNNWFEALDYMRGEIEKRDFDIAIIAAGAYGLPLAAHVKKIGKQSIHMGGATQIYFGIKGKRWDNHEIISKFYNEHWSRPLPEETPPMSKVIEDGSQCYW